MDTSDILALLAIGGAGYLVFRAAQKGASKPKPSKCEELVGAIAGASGRDIDDDAVRAGCNLADDAPLPVGAGLGGALILCALGYDDPFCETIAENNRRLNGDCKRPLSQSATRKLLTSYPGTFPADTCGEYKNGCVPVSGAPGWNRCAAGTRDGMPRDVRATTSGASGGVSGSPGAQPYRRPLDAGARRAYGSRLDGDPITFKRGGGCAGGVAWTVAGLDTCCAEDGTGPAGSGCRQARPGTGGTGTRPGGGGTTRTPARRGTTP